MTQPDGCESDVGAAVPRTAPRNAKAPAVTAVKTQGVKCVYQPLKEGYRGWGNGLGLMAHLDGLKLAAAYEYVNWYNSGWVGGFVAKQGYYSANPKTAKAALKTSAATFMKASRLPPTSPARRERRPTPLAPCVTAARTKNASPKSAFGTTSWTRPSS